MGRRSTASEPISACLPIFAAWTERWSQYAGNNLKSFGLYLSKILNPPRIRNGAVTESGTPSGALPPRFKNWRGVYTLKVSKISKGPRLSILSQNLLVLDGPLMQPPRHQHARWEYLMRLRRRHFLQLAAGALVLPGVFRTAWALPTRPVRIIVGFPAGGPTDIKSFGLYLSKILNPPARLSR
jgi:hypothetical protein